MSYVGILLLTGLLGAVELPGLLKKGERRAAAAAAGLLLLGAALAAALVARLPVPTMSSLLQWIFPPLIQR